MPRPRDSDSDIVNVTLRLPKPLVEWLDEQAHARVLGPNKLIELLIERGRRDLPDIPTPPQAGPS